MQYYANSVQLECFPIDRFMMNADIKLFLMVLGHTAFDALNDKELFECFEYAGIWGIKIPFGEKFKNRHTSEC